MTRENEPLAEMGGRHSRKAHTVAVWDSCFFLKRWQSSWVGTKQYLFNKKYFFIGFPTGKIHIHTLKKQWNVSYIKISMQTAPKTEWTGNKDRRNVKKTERLIQIVLNKQNNPSNYTCSCW